MWAEHSGISPRWGRDMNKTLSHALLPSLQAGSPAKDPGAEVSAALHFPAVVPPLPAGRAPDHGDTAEYLWWPQPERLGDFTIGTQVHVWSLSFVAVHLRSPLHCSA